MRKTQLIDILTTCRYDQHFFIYETNDYDQNVLLGKGTIEELRENDEFDLAYLTSEIEIWQIRDDGTMFIQVEGNTPRRMRQEEYAKEYVERWDNYDPKTRPWLYSAELDCFGHDICGSSDYLHEYGKPYVRKEKEDVGTK